ncbi:hypothetical protein D6D02_08294 [Aureobasidium pullulans]|uniref:Uncharacterized protein n=1 Tax=Aureobasidium pullulans TaxID=5580 RepID=A0A4S8UU44_AURPU|nr:hypothetical protein D6D26_04753 [Aureobasidium pullulans]THW13356.1 hypothetical protein D6D24_06093 [Aureobasidium pullulans]THX98040.1 hypothetical protein D6D03_08051 [Aureobasidium pullulans]THY02854.1 hypothetical protein D6D02_08294 [Aureobasidium pullulans]
MSTSTNRPLAVPKSRVAAPKPTTGKHPSRASISDQGVEEQDLPYEEREMRNQAARVLANDEMLLWLSRQRNESVLQTRIYCEARAAGLKDDMLKFDYAMDLSEENKIGAKSPAAKGTARVASGSGKNPGSPASSKKDRERERDRGRRSTGSAR